VSLSIFLTTGLIISNHFVSRSIERRTNHNVLRLIEASHRQVRFAPITGRPVEVRQALEMYLRSQEVRECQLVEMIVDGRTWEAIVEEGDKDEYE